MPLTASGMRVMMRQLAAVGSTPLDGIQVHPSEDLSLLRFDIDGPEGTPFSEGRFHVCLVFDEHYPEVPPKGYFRTKIFHPNVSDRGEICVNALKKDWNPQMGLHHILLVIRCLLVEPNPESALNEEAGRLLLEDYASYERKARMLTNIHARRPAGAARFTHSDGAQSKSPPQTSAAAPCGAPEDSRGRRNSASWSYYDPDGFAKRHGAHSDANPTMPPTTVPASDPPLDESVAEFPHPLRSLEGNNAYYVAGKVKDDDVRSGGANTIARGAGAHGGAGCSTSPTMMELHAAKAAQKKTTDKKKAALRRI